MRFVMAGIIKEHSLNGDKNDLNFGVIIMSFIPSSGFRITICALQCSKVLMESKS